MSPLQTLRILALAVFLSFTAAAIAEQSAPAEVDALVILSDDSLQTQGMAMALTTGLQARGSSIHVLLCDEAGKLALSDYQPEALAPHGRTPKDMLMALMEKGVTVQVCALFLPNSDYSEADLVEGITVATPPAMAAIMIRPETKVFTY